MKSSIDNKSPRQASHLKTKAKKNALMEDRFKQIETENRLLLEKMANIMRVRTFIFSGKKTQNLMNHSTYNLFDSISLQLKFKGGTDCGNENVEYGHSLNKDRRKRELQKITRQNKQILKRIQEAQPTYDHLKWEEESQAHDDILANICEFKTIKHRRHQITYCDDDESYYQSNLYR